MSGTKQIFTTNSPLRWKAFKWTGLLLTSIILAVLPLVMVTLIWNTKPQLPGLTNEEKVIKINNPVTPKG